MAAAPAALPSDLTDEQLAQLLDLGFDFLCTHRVSDFLDPTQVLPALDDALAEPRVKQFQARVATPIRERILDRLSESALKLEVWVPPALATDLAATLEKPAPLPRRAIDEVVGSEKVRDAVRATMRESLDGFIAKVSGSGGSGDGGGGGAGGSSASGSGGGGGGLMGAFSLGARAAAAASKGLLGGFGDEIQKRLKQGVGDFVDASVTKVQTNIADRLASEDTAKAIGKRRAQAWAKLLETSEPEAAKTIRKGNPADVEAAIPAILAHNLARAPVRAAIVSDLTWLRDELSKSTIGDLLDDAGIRTHVRAALHRHVLPLMKVLAGTPEISAWWQRSTTTAE